MFSFIKARSKPLLYWSALSRVSLTLVLSLVIWALVIGVMHLS